MSYVKVLNGSVEKYPYTIKELRLEYPNVSFPKEIPSEVLASYGVFEVAIDDDPTYNNVLQKIETDATPSDDGSNNWTLGKRVTTLSEDEKQANDAEVAEMNRLRRNNFLKRTDFYALSDVTMSSEMQNYRQSLRDITTHASWPHLSDDDWPVAP